MKSDIPVDSTKYPHEAVEQKWQGTWRKMELDTPDVTRVAKPFYNLMMFPYPSAEGLHVGNMYAFTGSDVYGRFMRKQGLDVLEPIGLDGFGIHSENYAFKVGRHPMDHATVTQKNFYAQLGKIGAMFDWKRTVETYDLGYYRWTQWLFTEMFTHGLAYRAMADVNFCPSCKTVLADEQVIDGKCERCGNIVEKRALSQWFFRITAYAEKLLGNLPSLDWSEKVKVAQENWIGKKEGINITYKVVDADGNEVGEDIVCFTTTPVNFAATFVAVAPEHPFVTFAQERLANAGDSGGQKDGVINAKKIAVSTKSIEQYVSVSKQKAAQDRLAVGRKKTGVFTGLYALNQVTGERMPIWISDFVLMGFGTGAIQGCPGHDMRDFEFAMQFDIPIRRVIVGPDGDTTPITRPEQVIEHGDEGTMINSEFLNGLSFAAAMQKTMDHFEEKGWGKRVTTYHLRDWLISRQRYWGPPIPMIHCSACETAKKGERADMPGWYTVPAGELPVILPRIDDYKPGDDGVAPLAKHEEFYKTVCPGCGKDAVRETDVSDTFLDSSWYFLRYPTVGAVKAVKIPFDAKITKKWLPVDMYTGGAEHSVLHLLYSRFVTMALHDWGYIDFDEPFKTFFAHGLVIKDGAKMSKSKGNVVNPDEYIASYGADALRLYLMFMGPFSQGGDFRDSAMEGMSKWIGRVWRMCQTARSKQLSVSSDKVISALHKAIKRVSEDLKARRYNTAIAAMMEFTNTVAELGGGICVADAKTFIHLLAPFAPHMTEELWQQLSDRSMNHEPFTVNQSIHTQPWPTYDPSLLVEKEAAVVVQVNGKVRDTLVLPVEAAGDQEAVEKAAKSAENVRKYLDGHAVKKTIFISGKLINFVL